MHLVAEVAAAGGSFRLPLGQCEVEREHGAAVRCRYWVRPEAGNEPRQRLASASLQDEPAAVRAVWPVGGEADLAPVAFLDHLEGLESDNIIIHALATRQGAAGGLTAADPCLRPRRRVLRGENLVQLWEPLRDVAELPPAIRNRFEQIKIAERQLVQDGLSDTELAWALLEQGPQADTDPAFRHVICTGGTNGRWQAAWGNPAAFRDDAAQHTVSAADLGGEEWLSFDVYAGDPRRRRGPPTVWPVVVRHHVNRTFAPDAAQRWLKRELPLFLTVDDEGRQETHLVYAVTDRFHATGGLSLGWSSALKTLNCRAWIGGPGPCLPIRPWEGRGTVVRAPRKGPEVEVRLDGFESNADGNLIRARLRPTDLGIHVTPAENGPATVSWSGRLTDPVYYEGAPRSEPAPHPSPSLTLDDRLTLLLKEIGVEHVDEVNVRGQFVARIARLLRLVADEVILEGQGVRVRLKQGQLYHERG